MLKGNIFDDKMEMENNPFGKHTRFITGGMTAKEYEQYKREIQSVSDIPTIKISNKEYAIIQNAFNQDI